MAAGQEWRSVPGRNRCGKVGRAQALAEHEHGFRSVFAGKLDGLHKKARYRVFADLERKRGDFPRAVRYSNGAAREVTVWCSNDYLGMGQNPSVIAAIARGARSFRRRRHP